MSKVAQERLREILSYDESAGVSVRPISGSSQAKVGEIAGRWYD